MFAQFVRKSFTLLVIYAVLIIGIFVLQFKNDSIISEKIGSLHITLLESVSEDNNISLKNKFNISFNGLSFSANDDNPLKAVIDNVERPVSLKTWKKLSPLSCELDFTNDIRIIYSISDEGPHAYLSTEVKLPFNVSKITVPYGFGVGTTVTEQSDNKIKVSSKKNAWELSAPKINRDGIVLTHRENLISYAFHDKTRSFSFDDALQIDTASETVYINNIENLKTNLINAFGQVQQDATVAEQEAVSYVAAMAEKGNFNEALDVVPQSFKRSALRTFLSAPYFDTLARINEPLQAQLKTYGEMIVRANEGSYFDVFNVRFIADYMCMHPGSESVRSLLAHVAQADVSECSVQQVTGILNVYNELEAKNPELANILAPVAIRCVEKIQSSTALDEHSVTIAEKGTFLSVIQAVQAGDAVYRYGSIIKNPGYMAGGRLIINSYLKDSASFDLRTLGELYPVVVHNNTFYPHFEVLSFNNGKAVWAWTCASNISYQNDNQGTITLNIDFPLSYTHYLIINGIDQFQQIYIYDMAFRTDYRFETYNSSGYVYQNDFKSLLLKSRHKSQVEQIRLVYSQALHKESVPQASETAE